MFFRGARSKFVARRDRAEMEIAPGQQRIHLLPVAVELVKRDAEYGVTSQNAVWQLSGQPLLYFVSC